MDTLQRNMLYVLHLIELGVLAVPVLAALLLILWRVHLLRSARISRDVLRRPIAPKKMLAEGELPVVSVQIPVFNEGDVVEKVIRSAAELDYPHELLRIQFLMIRMMKQAALLSACLISSFF